jgi:hypothetical protein
MFRNTEGTFCRSVGVRDLVVFYTRVKQTSRHKGIIQIKGLCDLKMTM